MSDEIGIPSGAPCAGDVNAAIRALRARLRETQPQGYFVRPLQRPTIAVLLRMAIHYQALVGQQTEAD